MTRTIPGSAARAWHEGNHAASWCYAGLFPLLARTDFPGDDRDNLAGLVKTDWLTWGFTEFTLSEGLIGVLMGPLSEGELMRTDIYEWPLEPEEWPYCVQSDMTQAKHLAGRLDCDRVDFLGYVYKAIRRAQTRRFRRLAVAISHRLEEVELVLRPELIQITEEVGDD